MHIHIRQGRWVLAASVIGLVLAAAPRASAQTIGTFPFRLEPNCNRLTITITQEGSTYRMAGWDDACGANERYPLRGTITPNNNGTLHFAFTVTRPNGIAVETSVRDFNLGNYTGNWTDSAGNTGLFVLNDPTSGGSPRTGPTSTLGANSVSTVNIVDGSVEAADINPAQVQLRVAGVCPAGQAVASVNQNGTVNCIATSGGGATAPVVVGNEIPVVNGITSACEDLDALSIASAPAGKLTCTATVTANFSHTNSVLDHLEFDIATTPGACGGLQRSVYEMPAEAPTAAGHDASVVVHRWFGTVAAGPVTLYLNARTGGTSANVLASQFTCSVTP